MNTYTQELIVNLKTILPTEEFLTAKQVAKALNPFFKISSKKLIEWSKKKAGPPSIRIAGKLFIPRTGVLTWFENELSNSFPFISELDTKQLLQNIKDSTHD